MKPRHEKGRQAKREEINDNIRQGRKEKMEERRRRTFIICRGVAVETCAIFPQDELVKGGGQKKKA